MKVFGEHTMDENGNVICKCGESCMFKMVHHIDFADKAVTQYVCQNCGNVIETEEEREIPWGDDDE